MNARVVARLTAVVIAVLAAGCGQSTCPVETPQVNAVQSCSVAPGTQVSIRLRTCQTCNQTAATCNVDLSGVSTFAIGLDPLTDVCDPASSCPSPAPSCAVPGVTCTFVAPVQSGDYSLNVFDPISNTVRSGTLTVGSGPYGCTTI